ncbi:MAG: cobalt ECF transporter T component CbiQ [Anaerolineae bacterium]
MTLARSLDPSVDGHSILHRADPRLKLVGLVAFVATASLLPRGAVAGYAGMLLLVAAAVFASRLSLLTVLKRAAPALFFATTVAVSALLQARGQEYFSVHVLWLTVAVGPYGVSRFLDILARAWLCGLLIGVHVAVTPFRDTVQAMRALGVPAMLTSVLALLYRYLAVLLDEGRRMERARESRTLRRPSLLRIGAQARVAGTMLGSLFLRAYGRSERVYQAMLSRGYDGDVLGLATLRWTRTDSVSLALWALGLMAALAVAYLGSAA